MKIIFASNNEGKIRELKSLCKDLPFTFIPQKEMGVDDIEETSLSFIENAILKARHAASITQTAALADDSGLVIPALQGAPGIYSARYSGPNANAKDNIAKVLNELKNYSGEARKAYFYCVLAFMLDATDPTPLICQGIWQGTILEKNQGNEGFGYDPIFFIPEENKTAAELPIEKKNSLSHRGQALRQLVQQLHILPLPLWERAQRIR